MKQDILLDDEDRHLLDDYNWKVYSCGYAVASVNGSVVYLHHLIIGFPPKGLETDHINRNKLDNRRSSLRHVTHRENLLNREFTNKSGYRHVYFDKTKIRNKPYRAILRRYGKSINIGYFKTAEEASRAAE